MKTEHFVRKFLFTIKNEPMVLILVILLVPVLFRTITDLRVAALFAGTLFLLASVLSVHQAWLGRDPWLGGASMVFLLFFVLPILGLRLFNWEQNFRGLSFLGIPSDWLHENSKWAYMVVLALSLRERFLRANRKEGSRG